MKRRIPLVAIVMFVFSLSQLAHAAIGPARARLDRFASGLHSLTGNFSQTLTDVNGRAAKASSGTLALQAPRQFRWDTLAPYKQTIVADGSRVWLYDPELDQVTVRIQSTEEAHSPLTVLTDIKNLDNNFKTVERGEQDGIVWLRLSSTAKDPQFDYADLGFDANGLARMSFRDQLGATTDIRLSGWQRNAAMPPTAFHFVPPPGADVIGDLPVMATQPLKD